LVNEGREIVSIMWFPHRPDWHELVYPDGEFQRVPGTLEDTAALAEALKLELVSTPDGSVQSDRKGLGDPREGMSLTRGPPRGERSEAPGIEPIRCQHGGAWATAIYRYFSNAAACLGTARGYPEALGVACSWAGAVRVGPPVSVSLGDPAVSPLGPEAPPSDLERPVGRLVSGGSNEHEWSTSRRSAPQPPPWPATEGSRYLVELCTSGRSGGPSGWGGPCRWVVRTCSDP